MTREEAIRILASSCIPGSKQTEALETLIPELAESEDERIKKIITDSVFYQYGAGVEYKDVLDYLDKLEKQKEQKPVDYEAELKKCKDNPLYFYDKYVSIKQKSEWSEEDAKMLVHVFESIRYADDHYEFDGKEVSSTDVKAWLLKSLRSQKLDASKLKNFDPVDVLNRIKTEWPMAWEKVVWKPSEEQMEALKNSAYGSYQNGDGPALRELYEQLKKL